MIIQSDQMSTNASRSYSSSQTSYSKYSGWTSSGNTVLSHVNGSALSQSICTSSHNGQLVSENSTQTRETIAKTAAEDAAEEKTDDTGTSTRDAMNDFMERTSSAVSIRRTSLQDQLDSFQKIQQQTLNYLLYILFGRKTDSREIPSFKQTENSFSNVLSSTAAGSSAASDEIAGGSYYSGFYYNEEETTCFDASGTVVTADGRRLSFSISLEMSRSFTQMTEEQIDYSQAVLCDPLVINLDNNIAEVSDQKFFFDIDADGTKESISMLDSGSGYLALDKNGDGVINDGSELFGTTSGNGFGDLAAYDSDGNGWIDEADEIFSKLRIWTKDEGGNDQLITLADAGVGAIYLGYENTDFSLNDMTDNTVNAVIRKTGIFLYENGYSGTVQQLDLAT